MRKEPLISDDWKPRSSRKGKKRFGMEYRYTAEAADTFKDLQWFDNRRVWHNYWHWYETAGQRDQAMEVLANKKFMDKYIWHEYRPIERQ